MWTVSMLAVFIVFYFNVQPMYKIGSSRVLIVTVVTGILTVLAILYLWTSAPMWNCGIPLPWLAREFWEIHET